MGASLWYNHHTLIYEVQEWGGGGGGGGGLVHTFVGMVSWRDQNIKPLVGHLVDILGEDTRGKAKFSGIGPPQHPINIAAKK